MEGARGQNGSSVVSATSSADSAEGFWLELAQEERGSHHKKTKADSSVRHEGNQGHNRFLVTPNGGSQVIGIPDQIP